ncbi:Dam family site-specific DNA-(adenine-N6)-methyltransferase [Halorubrum sp. 2020YC2]|uniref:DNA adenine methylase n=1 Tax=Halorubrum sp. 2020YC2 TaxID=2836432 RepID=UPI001BECD9EB|nr:Dam family site-specific DNA-(adenine-N6)-methyltransferase [Halorubrum sp. 2020YC2]QWC18981.1 Dam family site-specific DNA-(adenine-N6)-methyltransferase [Halorubrum sp. 2020YC2]
MAKPILKWAGGKRQIIDAITEAFPPSEEIGSYHEPFFGGGAVFFEEGYKYEAGSINDVNKRLINLYRIIQDSDKKERLIEILQEDLKPPDSEPVSGEFDDARNYYYQQREIFNKRPRGESFDEVKEAALLIYLNITCFNGLYRENQSGEFNVPWNHSNPDWDRSSRIEEAHNLFQGVTINCGDYQYVTDSDQVSPGDLVYFDPPYDTDSDSSSFDQYHFEPFDKEDQWQLRDTADKLVEQGVDVVISNAPSVMDIYTDERYDIRPIGARRSINSDGTDRGEVQEVVITTVDEPRVKKEESKKVKEIKN